MCKSHYVQVIMSTLHVWLSFDQAWACDLLGLDRKQLTLQQLGAAYRRMLGWEHQGVPKVIAKCRQPQENM